MATFGYLNEEAVGPLSKISNANYPSYEFYCAFPPLIRDWWSRTIFLNKPIFK
jgi:hypothetical protein